MADSTATDDGVVVLDLRGLNCPLPALRTRKALSRMAPGARLRVRCTDPLSVIDIPHLVATRGDVLEGQSRDGDVYTFSLRRSG
ncbi:tRNA 2-thiouridine synthesizing protein A [Roseiarcus fermentans]|uniref:tRNA 2-thiouridine synthesizing protein A n=1 Tax=Roseiarcus fermentans TaxID=1473586 RepID=A0A366EKD5_9HYPH|nr:sulfurtransferase TusA family protein [Roseiarcus fermentans]RBP02877.1 tRNA 2-thiouridine synthesizing protein A [Roseiarcus fermentans]